MASPDQRATTLKAAFRACSVEPLSGDDLQRYYVDLAPARKTESIEGVNTTLDFQEAGSFGTVLFTGHRGCGKSTELKRIQSHWETDYRVIYLEATEEIDINDAEYTDLYLIVIQQVERALRQEGLGFDRQLLKNFEQWFREVMKESETTVEKSVSVSGEGGAGPEVPFIARLLVKLKGQIKGSEKDKTVIRQAIQRDISRLKADINLLLLDGFKKISKRFSKGFLIIFDDLDRVIPKVGDHLFFDYAAQLQDLNCTVIYTVPISVLCSPKNIANTFDCDLHIVSMVNIYDLVRGDCDLDYDQTGLEAMTRVIEQRVVVESVFESRQQLLELVQASGGHVRQLMQMMRAACNTAQTRSRLKIQAEDVTYAINQQQFAFERIIPEEHYPLLAKVCLSKNVSKDETGQLMLFNTSVLEYNGMDRWNYPNPVVKRSQFFQQALAELQS